MAVQLQKGGSSRGKRARLSGGFSDINVTPLVDVMLVLLIVFMVAAPMLTVGVPVNLPKTNAARMNDQVEPVIVTIDAKGDFYLQETYVQTSDLIARLMALTSSNPEAKIYVRGDESIAYGKIMEVMGAISSAGFTKVSLLAQLPNGPQTATHQLSKDSEKRPIQQNRIPAKHKGIN
jgi:biopolymer transport protein TolR